MAKISFSPEELRRGLAVAKIVKPEKGDLHLRFSGKRLTIWSYDQRKQSIAFVSALESSEEIDPAWVSEEFYVSLEKSVLFETDLAAVSVVVNEKSFTVHASGGGINRQASLKKRAESSRRPKMPTAPEGCFTSLSRKDLDELLRQVSCAALIRETKTEEDMRINQVHFHPDLGCASSNARFYASLAFLPGLSVEVSLVSSDIPSIRAFCGKCAGDKVELAQDKNHVYLRDPVTGSVMSLNKIPPRKSPAMTLNSDGFTIEVRADRDIMIKSLGWASTVIDGTQRLSVKATRSMGGQDGTIQMFSGNQELSSMPVTFVTGDALIADFPVRIFASIAGFLEGEIIMKFGHNEFPTIMELSNPKVDTAESPNSVHAVHYLQSMKSRP